MKTQQTLWTLLSITLACCVGGLYLVAYAWHLITICDSTYVTHKPLKFVIEDTPTLVELNPFPDILAGDTYAIEEPVKQIWRGQTLTASKGVIFGPNGKETWYNLDMTRVIDSMRHQGYTKDEYPYDIREDGVKTLGGYVIVAADLNTYHRGDLVETSLGTGIVCDTGDFTDTTDVKIDIATNW